MPLAGLVRHPRRFLQDAAAAPRRVPGTVCVVATALVSLVVELAAAIVGQSGQAGVVLSLLLPLLLLAFWFFGAVLVGAGAQLMGQPRRRAELLAVTGLTYPVLVLFALIALLQAASPHLGGDALAVGVGLFALPLLGWFIALNAVAISAVYRTPPISALALTLLPYAALSALLLVLVVVISLLHAAGVA